MLPNLPHRQEDAYEGQETPLPHMVLLYARILEKLLTSELEVGVGNERFYNTGCVNCWKMFENACSILLTIKYHESF